jgi:hypothetical protein
MLQRHGFCIQILRSLKGSKRDKINLLFAELDCYDGGQTPAAGTCSPSFGWEAKSRHLFCTQAGRTASCYSVHPSMLVWCLSKSLKIPQLR